MNPAQALLREVHRSAGWVTLDPDLRLAIAEELERADTSPGIPPQTDHTTPPAPEWLLRAAGFTPTGEAPTAPAIPTQLQDEEGPPPYFCGRAWCGICAAYTGRKV